MEIEKFVKWVISSDVRGVKDLSTGVGGTKARTNVMAGMVHKLLETTEAVIGSTSYLVEVRWWSKKRIKLTQLFNVSLTC